MSEHTFTADEIKEIADEIRSKKYQESTLVKAELFAKIYRDPENRILVADDPNMPVVAASMLIGDDEGFELMEICAEHIPPAMKAIDFYVLAGLVQFEGEDAMPFAHLIHDEQIATSAAIGREMKTTVTVTLDGVEDTSDELAENPFLPE
ncbi:hypothetical protein BH09PSE5_BH09PSE5_09420 [soil metagenome]